MNTIFHFCQQAHFSKLFLPFVKDFNGFYNTKHILYAPDAAAMSLTHMSKAKSQAYINMFWKTNKNQSPTCQNPLRCVGQPGRPSEFCVRVYTIVYLTFCLPFFSQQRSALGRNPDLCAMSFVRYRVVFLLSAPGKRGSSFGGKIFQRVNFLSSRLHAMLFLGARERECMQADNPQWFQRRLQPTPPLSHSRVIFCGHTGFLQ